MCWWCYTSTPTSRTVLLVENYVGLDYIDLLQREAACTCIWIYDNKSLRYKTICTYHRLPVGTHHYSWHLPRTKIACIYVKGYIIMVKPLLNNKILRLAFSWILDMQYYFDHGKNSRIHYYNELLSNHWSTNQRRRHHLAYCYTLQCVHVYHECCSSIRSKELSKVW